MKEIFNPPTVPDVKITHLNKVLAIPQLALDCRQVAVRIESSQLLKSTSKLTRKKLE